MSYARVIVEMVRQYQEWCRTKSNIMRAHQALTTTLPSEEADMVGMTEADKEAHWKGFAVNPKPTPKPEPTEDHLRRACEELNRERRRKGLHHDDDWGSDGWGDHEVRTVARLLAERDAMQARVEGDLTVPRPPRGASLFAVNCREGTWHYVNHAGTWQGMPSPFENEAAPDPDLVLAREAVNWAHENARPNESIPELSALRALKLAKEQG